MSTVKRAVFFVADWAGCMLPAMLFISLVLHTAWLYWWFR